MKNKKYDIVVIGGGPAGLAAAIEAKKNGIDNILIIERDKELGGILNQCIHNGFGLHTFKKDFTGPEYAEIFIKELLDMGIEYKLDTMTLEINKNKVVKAINKKDGLMIIQANAIILSMGCREKTRGAIAIPGTRPSGIFTAGTAQRYLNMEGYMVGRKVIILGSGDIGLIMARRMTLEGAEVKLVAELMPFSSGLTRNIVQCLDDYNIPLLLSHTIVEIMGKDRLEKVVIAEVNENFKPILGTETEYECDTLLLSIGLIPENELSRNSGIQIDNVTGGPIVNELMETSIEGIFACGNVVHVHDLVDFVTEESMRAGKSAAKYIKEEIKKIGNIMNTIPENGISYIVPQMIREENIEEKLSLFMRVKNIYHDAKLVVKGDGEKIKSIPQRYLAPGEMQHISLKKELLEGKDYRNLTVEVVK